MIDSKQEKFLLRLIGKKLIGGFKWGETELYHFDFGEWVEVTNSRGNKAKVGRLVLHAMCEFNIICKKEIRRKVIFDGYTHKEEFDIELKSLIGLSVKRILLSDKNDLTLDFGDYKLDVVTYEDGEESWRLFTQEEKMEDSVHLVASDKCLEFH